MCACQLGRGERACSRRFIAAALPPAPHNHTPPHPARQVAFIKSFEAVYCFLPLMVKVLFINQVGQQAGPAHW